MLLWSLARLLRRFLRHRLCLRIHSERSASFHRFKVNTKLQETRSDSFQTFNRRARWRPRRRRDLLLATTERGSCVERLSWRRWLVETRLLLLLLLRVGGSFKTRAFEAVVEARLCHLLMLLLLWHALLVSCFRLLWLTT